MMGLGYEKKAYKVRDELSQLLLLGPSTQISGPQELAQAYSEGTQLAADLSASIIGVGIGKSEPSLCVEVRTIEELSGEQQDFLRKQYPDFPKEQLEFNENNSLRSLPQGYLIQGFQRDEVPWPPAGLTPCGAEYLYKGRKDHSTATPPAY